MADYINNFPDRKRLKLVFMRESEGVYQFGSNKVIVKLMRDTLQIKSGGGFLGIDQFLARALPEELSKLERKDPLKKVAPQADNADLSRVESSRLN